MNSLKIMEFQSFRNTLFCLGLMINYGITTENIYREDVSVTLYTDLVDIIGAKSRCEEEMTSLNTTRRMREHLISKQGIKLSEYHLHGINNHNNDSLTQECETIDIKMQDFTAFHWTCFSTGSNQSRAINWFMITCNNSDTLTIDCFERTEFGELLSSLCDDSLDAANTSKRCKEITYGSTRKYAICSKYFHIEKKIKRIIIEQGEEIPLMDIIAYLCTAFILITFIVTMLIPMEKCKPTYQFDKEKCLRVPLEIYEMYGVKYKPSTRKKLTRKSFAADTMHTVSSKVDTTIKEELMYGNGLDLPFNSHGFNKLLYNASHRDNNEDDDANNTDVQNTLDDDVFTEQDSGDYDTLVFPDMSDVSGKHFNHTGNEGNDNMKQAHCLLSPGDIPRMLIPNLLATLTRNQRTHARYLQRSRYDTISEEERSIYSDYSDHGERNMSTNHDADNFNDPINAKGKTVRVSFDDREVIIENDRTKSSNKLLTLFDRAKSCSSDVRNSVTNISYGSLIGSSSLNLPPSSHVPSTSRHRSYDVIGTCRPQRRNYNRFENDCDTTSDESDDSYYEPVKTNTTNEEIENTQHTPAYPKAVVEVTDSSVSSSQRPRISITVEFPEKIGQQPTIKTQERDYESVAPSIMSERKHMLYPYGSSSRNAGNKYKRSYSVGDNQTKQRTSTEERKFSMC